MSDTTRAQPGPPPDAPCPRAADSGLCPVSGRRICPARAFTVPEDVRHLDGLQLAALTKAFRAWAAAAARRDTRLSRQRVWLIYLLLRYSGARLGEILALNDALDLDLDQGLVRLGGDKNGDKGEEAAPRAVQLPLDVVRELANFLTDPAQVPLRGAVFRMDGGYIRRKFYERAKECGLPQELANPRSLRHSRAVELLRSGVPLPVVQAILGHSAITLTAHYLSFSDNDVKAIIQHHMHKEHHMKTSARNAFTGQVTSIRNDNLLAEVELTTTAGHTIVSVITMESLNKLGVKKGLTLTATIKAPHVIIVKEPDEQKTSMRNRFLGTIARINESNVAAEVVSTLSDGMEMCALITDESVKKLDLKVGDKVWTMFKAFAAVLHVD